MLDDNRRMHSWNFEPAVTLGTEPTGYVDPAYDFSQFVWPDETSIYPLSRAFHDFRKVTRAWFAKGLPSQMADAYSDVEQLCHLIQASLNTRTTASPPQPVISCPPFIRMACPPRASRFCLITPTDPRMHRKADRAS